MINFRVKTIIIEHIRRYKGPRPGVSSRASASKHRVVFQLLLAIEAKMLRCRILYIFRDTSRVINWSACTKKYDRKASRSYRTYAPFRCEQTSGCASRANLIKGDCRTSAKWFASLLLCIYDIQNPYTCIVAGIKQLYKGSLGENNTNQASIFVGK